MGCIQQSQTACNKGGPQVTRADCQRKGRTASNKVGPALNIGRPPATRVEQWHQWQTSGEKDLPPATRADCCGKVRTAGNKGGPLNSRQGRTSSNKGVPAGKMINFPTRKCCFICKECVKIKFYCNQLKTLGGYGKYQCRRLQVP